MKDTNQKSIEEKKEADDKLKKIEWIADPDPPSNVITLEIGDTIICTIMSREEVSGMHGTKQMKYGLQIIGEDESRPLYASTDLKPRLALHDIGDFIQIERIDDAEQISPEKNPMHRFLVYSPKE